MGVRVKKTGTGQWRNTMKPNENMWHYASGDGHVAGLANAKHRYYISGVHLFQFYFTLIVFRTEFFRHTFVTSSVVP